MMEIAEKEVLAILEQTKTMIENEDLLQIEDGEDFEDYVVKIMRQIAPDRVEQTGKQSFPDIIIGTYGVEVKFSRSNKWSSTGNSIFEGTYKHVVTDDIYLFFGRKVNNKKVKVKYDLYENCLADVKVTHSPRFYIDMELDHGKSILNEIGISYQNYRGLPSGDKGREIKRFLKSKLKSGEMVWWMDEVETSPIIKPFKTLKDQEKVLLRAELFSLFPEVMSSMQTKFEKAQLHLLNDHQVTFSRDLFTAGGQVTLIIKKQYVQGIPAIFGKLYQSAPLIKAFLQQCPSEKLVENWPEQSFVIEEDEVKKAKLDTWLKLIDHISISLPQNMLPSDIFKAGLKQQQSE